MPGPMVGGEGVGTAIGMPILLLPLFSRLPLPPLLPLQRKNCEKNSYRDLSRNIYIYETRGFKNCFIQSLTLILEVVLLFHFISESTGNQYNSMTVIRELPKEIILLRNE